MNKSRVWSLYLVSFLFVLKTFQHPLVHLPVGGEKFTNNSGLKNVNISSELGPMRDDNNKLVLKYWGVRA